MKFRPLCRYQGPAPLPLIYPPGHSCACPARSCALLLSVIASLTLAQLLICFWSTPESQGLLSHLVQTVTTLVVFSASMMLKRLYFYCSCLLHSLKSPPTAAWVNGIYQDMGFLKVATI